MAPEFCTLYVILRLAFSSECSEFSIVRMTHLLSAGVIQCTETSLYQSFGVVTSVTFSQMALNFGVCLTIVNSAL